MVSRKCDYLETLQYLRGLKNLKLIQSDFSVRRTFSEVFARENPVGQKYYLKNHLLIRRHGLRLRFLRKIRHRKWQNKIDQVPDIKNTSLWDDFRWFYKFDFSISKKYFIRLFTARRAVTKTMWKISLSSENVKFTWKLNVTFGAPAPCNYLLFLKSYLNFSDINFISLSNISRHSTF